MLKSMIKYNNNNNIIIIIRCKGIFFLFAVLNM